MGFGGLVIGGLTIAGFFLPDTKGLTDLAVGDCFALPSDTEPDDVGSVEVGEACDYQVTARISLDAATSASAAAALARTQCNSDVVFAPLEESWAEGVRVAICAQTQP